MMQTLLYLTCGCRLLVNELYQLSLGPEFFSDQFRESFGKFLILLLLAVDCSRKAQVKCVNHCTLCPMSLLCLDCVAAPRREVKNQDFAISASAGCLLLSICGLWSCGPLCGLPCGCLLLATSYLDVHHDQNNDYCL